MSLDIKETKEVLAFVTALGNGIGGAMEDGEWSFTDISKFIPAFTKLIPAISGIEFVDDELDDLSVEEMEELQKFVVDELDIPQEDAEYFIERAFSIAIELFSIVQEYFSKKKEEDAE